MLIAALNVYLSLAGSLGLTVEECPLPDQYCEDFQPVNVEESKSDESVSWTRSVNPNKPPRIYNGF